MKQNLYGIVLEALEHLGLDIVCENVGRRIVASYDYADYQFRFENGAYSFYILLSSIFHQNDENQFDVLKAVNAVNSEIDNVKAVVNGRGGVSLYYRHNVVDTDISMDRIIMQSLTEMQQAWCAFFHNIEES